MDITEKLFNDISKFSEVEAIALKNQEENL